MLQRSTSHMERFVRGSKRVGERNESMEAEGGKEYNDRIRSWSDVGQEPRNVGSL